MQAKVRQMILEEEQKARELEQQIIEMQGEDPCHQQQAPALNLNPRHPQIPAFAPATFQGLNYLDDKALLHYNFMPPLGRKITKQTLTQSTMAVQTQLSTS
jgi:cytochrome c5